jgi:demethylspheroidene O-methyltransferase
MSQARSDSSDLVREVADAPVRRAWIERAYAARDRLLASASFQRWASSFPLTRPIARRRARELFDLCAGFVYAQVLLASVRLGLPAILFDGPQTVDVLARRLGLPRDGALRLLDAAVSLRLAARRGPERYGLGELGAALIGNPGVAAMIEHHAMLYADLSDPVGLLRGGRAATHLAGYWPYAVTNHPADLTSEQVAGYTGLMSASQPLVADEVIDAYRFDRHRCLLDVGGGDGTFLSAVARRVAGPRLMLFDLPPVAEKARARFAAAGLSDRATAIGGDFLSEKLPTGADIISLVRIIHDHDDSAALAILRAARRALPDDGTLLIAEPMSETPGAEPVGAYFLFYLLAMGSGRPRSVPVLAALLREAGFDRVRPLRTHNPLLTRVISARAMHA